MKKIIWVVAILLIFWVAGSYYVLSLAPKSVIPAAGIVRSKQVDLSAIPFTEDFVTNKAGQKIQIITVSKPDSQDVILYFHGNGGRIPDIIKQASQVATVVSPSYPGFASSEGSPSESNIYETADLAMKFLLDKGYKQSQITVLGHSLGGADAVYVGAHYPNIKKLYIVNTFNSIYSICWPKYYILCAFTSNYFNSGKLAAQITVPTRVFHDQGDTVIPYTQGPLLFNAIKSSNKAFQNIPGPHNTVNVLDILKN